MLELKTRKRPIVASCISAVFAYATTATPVSAQSNVLEEIVVVAQKREQNLQDVGISVTAFSGDQMNSLGFKNSIDLIAHTPGMDASGYGGGAINSFNIRGVGQNDFSANQEAPVAVYIDEAYVSSNVSTRFSIFDIERVEVLRGPQGTLFGRNSTGGLVHYITRKPSQDFEGFIDLEVGEEGRQRLEGAIGGGISDSVSGRLAFIYNKDDGLIENQFPGAADDIRRTDDYSIRGNLLFEPSDDLSLLFKAQYSDEDASPGGYSFGLLPGVETDFFGYSDADGDPFTVENDFDPYQTTEANELGLTVEWDIGDATLTSITNYQTVDSEYAEDADVSPNSLFHYIQEVEVEQVSQEVRVSWEGENHRSVVGLFYLDIDNEVAVSEFGDVFFGPGVVLGIDAVQDTTTYAVFGQTEFDLSDTLALTAGLRLNRDEKDYDLRAPDFGFTDYTSDFDDDDYSAKLQLDYRPNDDWLIYGGISRGIKSGGFNLPLTPVDGTPIEFDSETLTAYEIGFKSSLGDTTRLNASVFYYDYEDYQAFNIDQFFNTLLFNANAENYGGEVELIMNPVQGLDLMLGVSYLDSEVTDLEDTVTFPTGKEVAPLSPEWTVNGLARYSWPAFGGYLSAQADFFWKDDHKFNLATSEPVLEDSFGVINARLGYETEDGAWRASLFVRNLTDEEYRTFAIDATAFFGSHQNILGFQRWYGANVRYTW